MFSLHQRVTEIAHRALLEFLQTQSAAKSYFASQPTTISSDLGNLSAASSTASTSAPVTLNSIIGVGGSSSQHFVTTGRHLLDPFLVASGNIDLDFLLFVSQPSISSLAITDPIAYARAISSPTSLPQSLRHLLNRPLPPPKSSNSKLNATATVASEDDAALDIYAQTLRSAHNLSDASNTGSTVAAHDEQRVFQHQLLLQSSLHTAKARAFVRISADHLMDLVEEKMFLIPSLFERLQRENASHSTTVGFFLGCEFGQLSLASLCLCRFNRSSTVWSSSASG